MSPNKKVTKEVGLRRRCNACSRKRKPPSLRIRPARIQELRRILTYILFHQKVFRLFDGRIQIQKSRQGGESEAAAIVKTGFLKTFQLRSEEENQCAPGVSKEVVLRAADPKISMIAGGNHTIIHGVDARERGTQRLFGRILLVLFLAEQEKYIRPTLGISIFQNLSTELVDCGNKICGQVATDFSLHTPCGKV